MSDKLLEVMQKQAEFWANSSTRFVTDEQLGQIDTMSDGDIDALPFGVIELSDEGKVLKFNTMESERTNVAKSDAIGKIFFTEVAPCTNNFVFRGSYDRGVHQRKMNMIFPYTFTYRMAPTHVKVFLYRSESAPRNWIFVNWE